MGKISFHIICLCACVLVTPSAEVLGGVFLTSWEAQEAIVPENLSFMTF